MDYIRPQTTRRRRGRSTSPDCVARRWRPPRISSTASSAPCASVARFARTPRAATSPRAAGTERACAIPWAPQRGPQRAGTAGGP
eukprot:7458081-Pyramimonas_sp.AAC.1